MQTQDLDARISALSASIDRLLGLLATATDTDALITLETAISDRQAQLESMEAERRYLADQVAMSTVSLNLVTEQVVPKAEPVTFLDGLGAGWEAFVGFFSGLLVVIGVLIPWLILGAIVTVVVVVLVKRRRARRRLPPPAPRARTGTLRLGEEVAHHGRDLLAVASWMLLSMSSWGRVPALYLRSNRWMPRAFAVAAIFFATVSTEPA